MGMSLDDKEMQQGDPARYGSGIGQWPLPLPGAATARMGALLAAVTEAAQAARTAQRRAAACGLGGSAFEQALEAQAQAAEALEKRVRPAVFY